MDVVVCCEIFLSFYRNFLYTMLPLIQNIKYAKWDIKSIHPGDDIHW